MYCPNCGTQNPDYFVYCKKCSEPLPKVNPEAAGEKHARRREESSVNILDANGPAYEPKQRKLLENAAATCPVAKTLHPGCKQTIR